MKYSKEWLTYNEWQKLANLEAGISDKIIIYLLYGCALRVSELCHLRIGDIDFREKLLIIERSKNQPNPRAIPVVPKIINMVKTLIKQYDLIAGDYIIQGRFKDKPVSRKSIYERVKRLAKSAKIKKNITTHTFRRSRITHLIDAGVPIEKVQLLAGHKRIDTTMKYYEYTVETLRKELAKLDPLAKE